jgi:hypothetical protein
VSRGGLGMDLIYGAAEAVSQPANRCPQNAAIGCLNLYGIALGG